MSITRVHPNPTHRRQLREEERKAKQGLGSGKGDEDEEEEDGGLDPDLAAAMGFGGFK